MIVVDKAIGAMKNAYAKYSNFKVGCAIELKDGTIITGANIENGSYGLSICAERSTIFTLINLGYNPKDIVAISVAGNTSKPVSPCGACRQVLSEFIDEKVKIYLTNTKGDIKETNIKELLPYQFEL